MPFPFVVVPGGARAIAFNPTRLQGLPNTTFVSINTTSGAASPLASGQHVPGLSSDNSLVLDPERLVVYGIYLDMRDSFVVALDLATGRLKPPVRVGHNIRFPSVLP